MPNYVDTFELDGSPIEVKDAQARSNISTVNSDLNALANRVTALEGLSRLSIAYSAQNETISITTGTHSS